MSTRGMLRRSPDKKEDFKMISRDFLAAQNNLLAEHHADDYAALGRQLQRRGISIDKVTQAVADFRVALPSWAVGTGGTRFARYPGLGEPRDVFDKLEDCAVVHSLTGATNEVSLHFPWDKPMDLLALKEHATNLGLSFSAVNSNTFQDQPGQGSSYKFGSLTHTDAAVRAQAIAHNIECIQVGQVLGSQALTIWIGDGANFPGQQHTARAFERYIESTSEIYAALPDDWTMLIEHKMYEPAFYATVIQDWGSSLMAAQALGPKALCLVDLGHHAPNVNIEMIVSRLMHAKRLGGFHFNDSRYGDDDLDAGSINPYRLFLIFNELVDAQWRHAYPATLASMLDQSHNVTDPIESLISSTVELQRALAQALLVDRFALAELQTSNDALLSSQTLKAAFLTDVSPILAQARKMNGAALDPIAVIRSSEYRRTCAEKRPAGRSTGGGIV